jgi:hypothetical protein
MRSRPPTTTLDARISRTMRGSSARISLRWVARRTGTSSSRHPISW